MTAPAIQCEKISKRYADKTVFDALDLTVQPGEYFGLVGINGCGKSTMIKSILDLIAIDGGTIELFGQSHRNESSRDDVSYLPDRFMPPAHLTGNDFIHYMLELHSVTQGQDDIDGMFDALELDREKMNVSVSKLSKGMTQKLGIASVLLSMKPLLVLDEPMSGLDPKARILFKRLLKEKRDSASTLFFSSHVLVDVDEIADRMAILHAGKIKFVGTPEQFKTEYDSPVLEDAYMKCISE